MEDREAVGDAGQHRVHWVTNAGVPGPTVINRATRACNDLISYYGNATLLHFLCL